MMQKAEVPLMPLSRTRGFPAMLGASFNVCTVCGEEERLEVERPGCWASLPSKVGQQHPYESHCT